MRDSARVKRLVGGIYSALADNLYEPLVVQGGFRMMGRHLHSTIRGYGRQAVSIADGEPLLDMPVGTGYFTFDVAQAHDGIVIGVDLAEGMVREAQRKAADRRLHNLVVAKADAHRLPFADETFPVVMCWNGLQVIPGTDATVTELARVLKTGGTLFASVVTLPLGRVVGPRAARRLPPFFVSPDRFAAALSAAGLTVNKIEKDRLATVFTATR